jgi:hypothetical protein
MLCAWGGTLGPCLGFQDDWQGQSITYFMSLSKCF